MQQRANIARRTHNRSLAAALALCLVTVPAAAQQGPGGVLRVTVDHAATITLKAVPSIVLIADPQIADIVNERHDLVFVLGKKPGATNLLAYDANGKRLLDREIVVVPPNARTVTITRETDQTDYTCAPRCAFGAHLAGGPGAAPTAAEAPPPAFAPPSSAPLAAALPKP